MKTNFVLLGLIAAVFLITGCQKKNNEAAHEESGHGAVHLTKEVQASIELAAAVIEKKKITSFIEVYGAIAQDTEDTRHILPDQPGILKVFKVSEGDTVEEKSPIAVIETQNHGIKELLSPTHGIVMARYVQEGDRVDAVTSIATIANPDLLRASFDLYEKDLSFVKLGQSVVLTSTAYPGKKFEGKVVFISPRVDDATRTVKIRVDTENKEHLLKFGMFVAGQIARESDELFVAVPQEAIQVTDDVKIVFVQTGDETFEAREIKTGIETAEEAAVLENLQEGEKVVTKGSFVLKSELLKEELGEEGHSHA